MSANNNTSSADYEHILIGVPYFVLSIGVLLLYIPCMIVMAKDSELKSMGKLSSPNKYFYN